MACWLLEASWRVSSTIVGGMTRPRPGATTVTALFCQERKFSPQFLEIWRADLFSRRLAFFYITIPFVLSILSSIELSRLNRKELLPRWIPISSACAFVLWAIQVGWQARCIWSRLEDRGACPIAFAGGSVPHSTWGTGLVAAWVVPWFILPLLAL